MPHCITIILSYELPALLTAVALTRDPEGRVTIHIPADLPYPAAQSAARRLIDALRARPRGQARAAPKAG